MGEGPKTPVSGRGSPGRISGIDICRSVAILLAMINHVFAEFEVFWAGQSFLWLKFISTAATPIFVSLFGVMLELVYVERYRNGHAITATSRLLNRAGQCYILYVITVIALVVVGKYTLGFATRTILLAGMTPYTDILRFYAVSLLFAPLIIWVRIRFGLIALFAFLFFVHLAYPILKMIPAPEPILGRDLLGPIVGFLYGGGHSGIGAPSLLHGLTFVVGGMIIGSAFGKLLYGNQRERRQALLILGGLMLLGATAVISLWSGLDHVLQATDHSTYRNDNHPFYYAVGLVLTILATSVCVYLFDVRGYRWADGVTFIGKTSLFTFAFGNMVLYLQTLGPSSGAGKFVIVTACVAFIILQSWLFFKLSSKEQAPANRLWIVASRAVKTLISTAGARIGELVTPIAIRYAAAMGYAASGDGTPANAAVQRASA
ncbi:OpgC domain-containing protein [Hyphomicrobium sp. CS1GBMeth3]|uniref:OpgC domain-containing protein n=1 Tax=Hyphomicrobium sp. CS1GBMeth3 TaxID=1892845 RepID=UPI0015C55CD5|nr:OpgC domain-containing protein [Hyphomicrobium sp. CS1GBMeth3]